MSIINKLLDALDTSVNSNSFWLSFEIADEESFFVSDFLLHQLKTKMFHHQMIKQDLERGWNLYSELVFPKDWNTPVLLQKPGNIWNGNEIIKYKELTKEDIQNLLIDLLTGQEKHFTRSGAGTQFSSEKAELIIDEFLKEINRGKSKLIGYDIEPNFLNVVDDTLEKDSSILPYFEKRGRDLALGFRFKEEFTVLLTNG